MNVVLREPSQHTDYRETTGDEPSAAIPTVAEIEALIKACLVSAYHLPVSVTATRTDR